MVDNSKLIELQEEANLLTRKLIVVIGASFMGVIGAAGGALIGFYLDGAGAAILGLTLGLLCYMVFGGQSLTADIEVELRGYSSDELIFTKDLERET